MSRALLSQLGVGSRIFGLWHLSDGYWHVRSLLQKRPDGHHVWAVVAPDLDFYEEDFGEASKGMHQVSLEDHYEKGVHKVSSKGRFVVAETGVGKAVLQDLCPVAWIAAKACGEYTMGDVYVGKVEIFAQDRGVVETRDGVANMLAEAGAATVDPGPPGDIRILPLSKVGKKRRKDFKDLVADLEEHAISTWSVDGPRAWRWLLRSRSGQGLPPSSRHFWWRRLLRTPVSDPGIEEYARSSEVLEQAVCHDRLNVSSCLAVETIARRKQVWKEVYGTALAGRSLARRVLGEVGDGGGHGDGGGRGGCQGGGRGGGGGRM